MQIADVTLGTFEGRLRQSARRDRRPLGCIFELTPTCNLRCHFCYVALDPYKGPYLSTEQVFRVLDKIDEAGVLWLTLTGGEILTRRDFPEIYRYARSKGFLVTLFTNATMMTERHAALFRELPPFLVEVSIYGHTAEIYEATTQIKGSFQKFERGIDLIQSTGTPLKLKTPISTFTQDHVADLYAYAERRGAAFGMDMTIDHPLQGDQQQTLYRLTPRKVAEAGPVVEDIQAKRAARKPNAGPLPDCSHPTEDRSEELYQCGAGRSGFFVDANGRASHCIIDREPAFELLEMPWSDIWAQMGNWVTQPLPKEAPCHGCDLRKTCGSCPARSRLATGSPYFKDPYYCDVTHAIYGLEPVQHPDYRAMARPLGACAS